MVLQTLTEDELHQLKLHDIESYCLHRYGSLEKAKQKVGLGITTETFCNHLENIRDWQKNNPELFK